MARLYFNLFIKLGVMPLCNTMGAESKGLNFESMFFKVSYPQLAMVREVAVV